MIIDPDDAVYGLDPPRRPVEPHKSQPVIARCKCCGHSYAPAFMPPLKLSEVTAIVGRAACPRCDAGPKDQRSTIRLPLEIPT